MAAGVDHLTVGDHVSFADGHGADGLIQPLRSSPPTRPFGCKRASICSLCVTRRSSRVSSRRSRSSPPAGSVSASESAVTIAARSAVWDRPSGAGRPDDGEPALRARAHDGRGHQLPRAVPRGSRRHPPGPGDAHPGAGGRPVRRGARPDGAAGGRGGWASGSLRVASRRRPAALRRWLRRPTEVAFSGSTRFSSGPPSTHRPRERGSDSPRRCRQRMGCRLSASSATRRVVHLGRWLRRSRRISPWAAGASTSSPKRSSLPAAMEAAAEVKALLSTDAR